jgi:hypothetical protein
MILIIIPLPARQGIVAFLPVVVYSELKVPALFAPTEFSLRFDVFDSRTCTDCDNGNDQVLEIMQNQTSFFQAAVDRTDAIELRTPGAFNFTCTNNATCAWGLGFCASCFQVTKTYACHSLNLVFKIWLRLFLLLYFRLLYFLALSLLIPSLYPPFL